MIMSGDFGKLITHLIILGFVAGLAVFGIYLLIDWLFIDHAIESTKLITPEIKLIIKNNGVDTVFVYRKQ